jgi:GAF domain-containing protein
MGNEQALAELKLILRTKGPSAALVFLNGLTNHRYSALYQFAGDSLRNLYFFDRENPEIEDQEEIPVTASYCVFVRNSGDVFHTSDALRDERVREHPKREQLRAYCGVPVLDQNGKLFGSICHFNVAPAVILDVDVTLMEAAGRLLQEEGAIDVLTVRGD